MLNQELNLNQYETNNDIEDNSYFSNDEFRSTSSSKRKIPFNRGRWTTEEHLKFIKGFLEYGNEWKKVQSLIITRSSTQARSHAQKFFLRIKKNINLLDGISFPFSNSQDSLNDSVSIKNFLELLTSEEKEKLDPSTIQLSENQKLKLLHLVAKLSNTSSLIFANKDNQNDKNHHHLLHHQDKNKDKDKAHEKYKSINTQGNSDDEIDTMAATISQIAIRQIFEIKKDKSRRESMNSNIGHSQRGYKSYNHKMSVDDQLNMKDSFVNQIISSDLSSTNSMTSNQEDTKYYNEMMVLFGKKRKSESKLEDLYRPRFYSTNEERSDLYSHKMVFNNPDFFPKHACPLNAQNEQKKNDIEYSLKNNPFLLNFDTFYQNMSNNNDCLKNCSANNNIITNQEMESLKVEYDDYNLQNDLF